MWKVMFKPQWRFPMYHWFNTFEEACAFAKVVALGDLVEPPHITKRYPMNG